MSTLKQQRAMIDEARIREHAKNVIALFLMEQGTAGVEAHASAAKQVADSSLNLLKKILAGDTGPRSDATVRLITGEPIVGRYSSRRSQ